MTEQVEQRKEDQHPGEGEPLLSYTGIIYVRPVGRGVCLVDLEGWPQFEDELLGERFYEATIIVTKEVPEPGKPPKRTPAKKTTLCPGCLQTLKIQKLCAFCGTPFLVSPSEVNKYFTCSRACYLKRRVGGLTLWERILTHLIYIPGSGCWMYDKPDSSNGYGRIKDSGKKYLVHIVSYEHYVGPVPGGLELDHLCRNRPCFNCEHLEPVTSRENILRGEGLAAHNAKKTHCRHGHPYEGENLVILSNRERRCRECLREIDKRYKIRHRLDISSLSL